MRLRLTPNAISLLGVIFSLGGALLLLFVSDMSGAARVLMLLGAAACIQLRLLCNMIDGMVAIEGGQQSPAGAIFNELPDRFSDVVTLAAAGLVVREPGWGEALGWLAAVLAVLTAYVRALGASKGTPEYFLGPMAKQQRMAIVTASCIVACFEPWWNGRGEVFAAALTIIIVGCAWTIVRRTWRIISDLSASP